MLRGTPYIIAAPSGAGKTSLVNALIQQVDNIVVSISHTTRPKRTHESDGENYFFIEEAAFHKMVAEHAFLEHAVVFGYHYGTSKIWVEEKLASGQDVILEIDWQGAQQIRELHPETTSIFIFPPSLASLRERLEIRAQDSPTTIASRMAAAQAEMSHYQEFDYLVVNQDFATALADLTTIIYAKRLQRPVQQELLRPLLADLLSAHR